MDSPWPMQSHDLFHTGQSPYSTESNNGAELWKFKTFDDGWIDGGIVIDKENVLYFGDSDGFLYAIYPNATLKWKYDMGHIWSTPALAEDGTVYVGSFGNDFYAFNPDGSVQWIFDALNSISSSPALAADGTIYFGTMGSPVDGNRIYALNPDGTMKWFHQTGNAVTSSPAIGSDGTIYIGSLDRYLYAMNPDGTLKWRYKTGDEIHSDPCIGPDGIIYFGSNDYYFYAVYPNGTLHWKYRINGHLYSSAAIGDDGIIYCPDHDLYAFYPDGRVKWIFDFGEDLGVAGSSPAISREGAIYVGVSVQGANGGYIITINPDGTERWRKELGTFWQESSPAIGSDGTVYIGSASTDPPHGSLGYLYAFGEGNLKPEPPQITGPSSVHVEKEYSYTFQSTDPEGKEISYYVDWDDNSNSGWQGPFPSGTKITLTHKWMYEGERIIRAKARDEQGKESEIGTLALTVPKINKIYLRDLLNQYINLDFFQLFK